MAGPRPRVIEEYRVDPDPSITSAIGRHHTLETAVTDVVDNSIDAGARNVLVRVLQREERAVGLLVVDDGRGMDSDAIDVAMGYAHRKDHDTTDLGHFGIGLKAASLSQADVLHVWSRRWGAPPVGRGLERATLETGPIVQAFAHEDAALRLASVAPGFALESGTVVEWRDVRGFLQSPDPDEQRDWLERALERLRSHLGLVLHRILTRGGIGIRLDVVDEDYPDLGGVPRTVEPLDPFGYPSSGAVEWPREFDIELNDGLTTATLHIWPAGSTHPNWLLGGRVPAETQGLYVYRNDRLLQAGGWNSLTNPGRDLALARIELDIDPVLASHVTINPEKTGVTFDAQLSDAWASGRLHPDGTFADYLEVARTGARAARKRNSRPIEVVEPDKGFASEVYEAFEDNAQFTVGSEPVSLRWKGLPDDEVFRVDRENRTVWLNQRYRRAVGGASGLRNDDVQPLKVLLHLLLGPHATSTYAGSKDKREEVAWNAILLAAVRVDESQHQPPVGSGGAQP